MTRSVLLGRAIKELDKVWLNACDRRQDRRCERLEEVLEFLEAERERAKLEELSSKN